MPNERRNGKALVPLLCIVGGLLIGGLVVALFMRGRENSVPATAAVVKFRVRHPLDVEVLTSAATRPAEAPSDRSPEAMEKLDAAWERECETWAGLLVVNEDVLKAVAERVRRLPAADTVRGRFVAIAGNGIEAPKLVEWARRNVKVRRVPKSALIELVVDAGEREASRDVAGYVGQELMTPLRARAENELQLKTKPIREVLMSVNARLTHVSTSRQQRELDVATLKARGLASTEDALKEEAMLKQFVAEEEALRGQKARAEQEHQALIAVSAQTWARVFIAGGDARFPER